MATAATTVVSTRLQSRCVKRITRASSTASSPVFCMMPPKAKAVKAMSWVSIMLIMPPRASSRSTVACPVAGTKPVLSAVANVVIGAFCRATASTPATATDSSIPGITGFLAKAKANTTTIGSSSSQEKVKLARNASATCSSSPPAGAAAP